MSAGRGRRPGTGMISMTALIMLRSFGLFVVGLAG